MIDYLKILILILFFSCIFTNTIKAEESTSTQIIFSPEVYYSGSEVLHLEGNSTPNTTIELFLTSSSGESKTYSILSDETGQFIFLEKVFLEKGVWEAKVRSVTGVESDASWSSSVSFISSPTVFKFLGFSLSFQTLNIFILVSVSLFVIGVILAFVRFKSLNTQIRAFRLGKTDSIIQSKIDTVTKNIAEELWHLERKLKKNKSFTSEEAERREKLLLELKKYKKGVEDDIVGMM